MQKKSTNKLFGQEKSSNLIFKKFLSYTKKIVSAKKIRSQQFSLKSIMNIQLLNYFSLKLSCINQLKKAVSLSFSDVECIF